jgi:hypothetical protein
MSLWSFGKWRNFQASCGNPEQIGAQAHYLKIGIIDIRRVREQEQVR